MKSPLLEIRNLTAWYQKNRKVLTEFSLNLYENETAGLIGLNGAGKTTLLKVLSGLLSTYHCDGIWLCHTPVKLRERNFKICRYTVFAEDNAFQYFTFWEYLSYVFGAYKKEIPDVTELIDGFRFENYTQTLIKDLSTGNRKKVFLITAFALKPKLLFLDEPVGALDFQSTEYLYQRIIDYKKYGTVLFSSHVLESITMTSDRVFVLEDGRIRQIFENDQIDAAKIREALSYGNDI